MAAGDASRTWLSDMVETRRQEWKPEMAWEHVITLRDRLNSMLNEIRFSRGIRRRRCGAPPAKRDKVYRWMENLPSAPASADRDRLPVVREMGRRPRQCLAARRLLTSLSNPIRHR
jgi:hypothetical protein